jgi:hypothetical protein
MGLFQFMAPDDPRPLGFGAPLSGTYVVRLEVKVDGRTVATATATRRSPQSVGVTTKKLTLAADGVYGVLYRPKDLTTRKPALLVFGGTEGGLSYPYRRSLRCSRRTATPRSPWPTSTRPGYRRTWPRSP